MYEHNLSLTDVVMGDKKNMLLRLGSREEPMYSQGVGNYPTPTTGVFPRDRKVSLSEEITDEAGKDHMREMDCKDNNDWTEEESIPTECERSKEVAEEDQTHMDAASRR